MRTGGAGGERAGGASGGGRATLTLPPSSLGVILASLLGLPIVMLKLNDISTTPFALGMASTGVTLGSAVWYWLSRGSSREY